MQFKRLLLLTMAACFTFTGCNEVKNIDSNESVDSSSSQTEIAKQLDTTLPEGEDALTAQVNIEKLELDFSNVEIEGDSSNVGISEFFHTDNGYGVFLFPHTSSDISFAKCSEEFQFISGNKLTIPAPQDDYYYTGGIYVYSDNKLYSFVTMEWHNGMKPYIYSDDIENFDWDAYNAESDSRYMLCTHSMDGTLIDAVVMNGLRDSEYYDEYNNIISVDQFYIDNGEAYIALDSGSILRLNKEDGSISEIYSVDENIAQYGDCQLQLYKDRDGKTLLYSRIPDIDTLDVDYVVTVNEFDLQTGELGENLFNPQGEAFAFENNYMMFLEGRGDIRFAILNSDNITAVKYDGSEEVILDWTKSNLEVSSVQLLDEGTMLYSDWGEYGIEMNLLKRKRQSELKETPVLDLMVISSWSDMPALINDFNRSQSDFRVEAEFLTIDVSDPAEYEKAMEQAEKEFQMKLLTDDAPDLVITLDSETIFNYGNKGAFADLYALMENDAEMNKSAFLPNILKAYESENGELYGIPSQFEIDTVMIKSKFCDKENWTMNDMISTYDNAESDYDIYKWYDRQRILEMFLRGMDFVDEKSGTCSFNSSEFIEMLKFCKRFPTKLDIPEKDYDNPAQMELLDNYYYSQSQKYITDEDLIYSGSYGSADSIGGSYSYAKAAMGGEDVTLVGYPSNNGNGTKLAAKDNIAISSKCENIEAAWAFVKSFLSQKTQYIPVLEEKFEKTLDGWKELGGFGNSGAGYYEDDGFKVYPLTQEERDYFESLIRSLTTLSPTRSTALNDIIYEEAEAFFADAKTAEETAEIIQNRAEILVSEQSW
ncbi:MAG: extracellular solute-binding protein [Ruminococcus sp.]|nr:extracellular solute-binding protein [Ruminococcus sp.]